MTSALRLSAKRWASNALMEAKTNPPPPAVSSETAARPPGDVLPDGQQPLLQGLGQVAGGPGGSESGNARAGRRRLFCRSRKRPAREELLKETGGGIARFFASPARLQQPREDEAEDSNEVADEGLLGPTQMWATVCSPTQPWPQPNILGAASSSDATAPRPLAARLASVERGEASVGVAPSPTQPWTQPALPAGFALAASSLRLRAPIEAQPPATAALQEHPPVETAVLESGIACATSREVCGADGEDEFLGPTQMWGASLPSASPSPLPSPSHSPPPPRKSVEHTRKPGEGAISPTLTWRPSRSRSRSRHLPTEPPSMT